LDPKGTLTLAFSFPADDRLLTLHEGGVVKVWNINTEKSVSQFQLSREKDDIPAEYFAVSPNGRYFAASYADGIAVLFNSGGRQQAVFKCQAEIAPKIAFSSNGRLLATGGSDGTVRLWDTTSRRELLTLRGTPYPVLSIAFSGDETKLAVIDSYGYLRVWRAPVAGSTAKSRQQGTPSLWSVIN
jgi:WD40 repeat protein